MLFSKDSGTEIPKFIEVLSPTAFLYMLYVSN